MGHVLFAVDDAIDRKASFLSRQFEPALARGQITFDVLFGVVAPILCFVLDPIVFKSGGIGPPILGEYQLFAYLVSGLAILALIAWLCLAHHLTASAPIFSGVFVAGAVFSVVVGIVIFPFAVLGLIIAIGLAGFTPFLTAFVYLRNGIRAFHQSSVGSEGLKVTLATLAVFVTIGFPGLISYQVSAAISASVTQLLNGDVAAAEAAAYALSWAPVLPQGSLDKVVRAYGTENDAKKKDLLRRYYQQATGRSIEQRLAILND